MSVFVTQEQRVFRKIDIIRNDRNRNGGGVSIYVRNTISYRNLSHTIPDNLEAVVVEIHKPNSRPFIVSTIYRPPNSTVFISLEKLNILLVSLIVSIMNSIYLAT